MSPVGATEILPTSLLNPFSESTRSLPLPVLTSNSFGTAWCYMSHRQLVSLLLEIWPCPVKRSTKSHETEMSFVRVIRGSLIPAKKARNRYHVPLLTIDSTSRARLFSPACQALTHRVRALGTSRLRRTLFDKTLPDLRYRSAARFAVVWDQWSP